MLLLFKTLITIAFAASPIDIPREYVQQNQHNAFFLFNIHGEALTSECYLSEHSEESKCFFYFESHDDSESVYETPFTNLYTLHPLIVRDLKNLQAEWLKKYPLDSWGSKFALFREDTHNAMAQLIQEIETESLANRNFIPRNHGKFRKSTPYFYDSELTDRVFDIFKKYLKFRYKKP